MFHVRAAHPAATDQAHDEAFVRALCLGVNARRECKAGNRGTGSGDELATGCSHRLCRRRGNESFHSKKDKNQKLVRVCRRLIWSHDVETNLRAILGAISDKVLATQTVGYDNGGVHRIFDDDLGFAQVHEVAIADRHTTALGVNGWSFYIFLAPTNKVATIEYDVAGAVKQCVVVGCGDPPETARGKFYWAGVSIDDFDSGHELAVHERDAGVRLSAFDADGGRADVGAALSEQAITRPAFELGKLITDVVADAKAVVEKFPIRAREDECDRFFAHELVKRAIPSAPELTRSGRSQCGPRQSIGR